MDAVEQLMDTKKTNHDDLTYGQDRAVQDVADRMPRGVACGGGLFCDIVYQFDDVDVRKMRSIGTSMRIVAEATRDDALVRDTAELYREDVAGIVENGSVEDVGYLTRTVKQVVPSLADVSDELPDVFYDMIGCCEEDTVEALPRFGESLYSLCCEQVEADCLSYAITRYRSALSRIADGAEIDMDAFVAETETNIDTVRNGYAAGDNGG